MILIDTGLANLASVEQALRRLGAEPARSVDAESVRTAPFVVLPGVGHFAVGMARLRAAGLVDALRERVTAGRPTLAICLGLQLLAEASDEAPGCEGLGLLRARVTAFPDGVSVPQLGWNSVEAEGRLLAGGAAYYANSYRLTDCPDGWTAAWSDHGGPFVAAVERGRVLGCQFHPELSGAWGGELLRRWLEDESATRAAPSSVGPRIVPCLDVADGRVVKGVRFQGLRDAGDPVACAARYAAGGADELVMLDVSATTEGRRSAADTVAAIRRVLDLPLTVGGGVRTVDDAARLLGAGADKVAVNTAAVSDPTLVDALAERFGSQCAVVAVDAARAGAGWELVTRSGTCRTGRDAVAWCGEVAARGAGEVLLTSWDRDGTGDGYDLELLRAVRQRVSVPIVASGGASGPDHLVAALQSGASAVLAASIFHDGVHSVASVKRALAAAGVEVRA